MPGYAAQLVIDLGDVGYRSDRQRFRIRLCSAPLNALIEDSRHAHRLYELFLIDRPGDVWDYVVVELEEAPACVRARLLRKCKTDADGSDPAPQSVLPLGIPFKEFDRLFHWAGDDTEPEDAAWLRQRDSAEVRAFSHQLLETVRAAQASLDSSDPLLRHVVGRIHAGAHPYAYLSRETAIAAGRVTVRLPMQHSPGFYEKLRGLLRDPELVSVAYCADGDFEVCRAIATEQRRRAEATGHRPGHALWASALVNRPISNQEWDSEIWFLEAGLAHGDLLIDDGFLGASNVRALAEGGSYRSPGRYVLLTSGADQISGFDTAAGEGWVLYSRRSADGRRIGLERTAYLRHGGLGPVLKFAGAGATVYDFEKAVIVLGPTVADHAREALATVLAEWERHGGDPVVLVLGEGGPLERGGCRGLLRPPPPLGAAGDELLTAWLDDALRRLRPWIDVVVALDAPPWAARALADRCSRQHDPWAPWIVTNGSPNSLRADLRLEGDIAEALASAHARAKDLRPRPV